MSTGSYEDYEREYNACLARIRSYLAASGRTRTTLTECDRLLQEAKRCATAMHAMAEIEGNGLRVQEATQRMQRDIQPLQAEIARQLQMDNRQELFSSQSPDIESSNYSDFESLIQSSDDLLRDSHAILAETEYIGTQTLHQMGRQREQIQNASANVAAVQAVAYKAKTILTSMSRKACKSKLSLYCMIAVLAAANVFVLYRIYKKHHRATESD